MYLTKNAILFLMSLVLTALAVFLKMKVGKTIGDIALVVATLSFYYFVYRAFLKKKSTAAN